MFAFLVCLPPSFPPRHFFETATSLLSLEIMKSWFVCWKTYNRKKEVKKCVTIFGLHICQYVYILALKGRNTDTTLTQSKDRNKWRNTQRYSVFTFASMCTYWHWTTSILTQHWYIMSSSRTEAQVCVCSGGRSRKTLIWMHRGLFFYRT